MHVPPRLILNRGVLHAGEDKCILSGTRPFRWYRVQIWVPFGPLLPRLIHVCVRGWRWTGREVVGERCARDCAAAGPRRYGLRDRAGRGPERRPWRHRGRLHGRLCRGYRRRQSHRVEAKCDVLEGGQVVIWVVRPAKGAVRLRDPLLQIQAVRVVVEPWRLARHRAGGTLEIPPLVPLLLLGAETAPPGWADTARGFPMQIPEPSRRRKHPDPRDLMTRSEVEPRTVIHPSAPAYSSAPPARHATNDRPLRSAPIQPRVHGRMAQQRAAQSGGLGPHSHRRATHSLHQSISRCCEDCPASTAARPGATRRGRRNAARGT